MNAGVSSRINLMRIVLISGIVFVHVPYDPANSPFLGLNGLVDWLRVFLGDSLFRIGVPCLSAISGYLLFRRGFDGFSYGRTLRTKATTVLVPFLLWNLSFLAFVLLAQKVGVGIGYLPDALTARPREMATFAFALEGWPINLPLYFLRDLLLCLVFSPLLAILVMRYPRATLLVFFAYAVLPVPNGIFLKKSILFGFSTGIAIAVHRVDIGAIDRYASQISAAVVAAALLLSIALFSIGPEFPVWLDMLRAMTALSGIVGAWALSDLLLRTRLGLHLSKGGGLSFWIFCAHYPLLVGLWMVWNRAGIDAYVAFYFAAPLLTILILVATHAIVQKSLPGLHALLTGSRSSGRKPLANTAHDVRYSTPQR